MASRCVSSRNLENEEAKARYRAVKIHTQWVVTPGKQTKNQDNYYISNKVLLEERDKQENVAVTGAAIASCLKQKTVKHSSQCHVLAQSPPGRRPNDKYTVNSSHRTRFV